MYKRSAQGWLKHWDFILLDLLSAQLAFILAYCLRFGFGQFIYAEELYRNMGLLLVLFCVLVAVLFNTMHDVLRRGWAAELQQTLTQCLLVFAAEVIFLFSVKDAVHMSRITLWIALILYAVIAYCLRMLHKYRLKRSQRFGKKREMLLITDRAGAEEALTRFRENPVENINICGIVLVDRQGEGEIAGVPVVAELPEAAHYICREWIDEVYVSLSDAALMPRELVSRCGEMGVTVHLQMTPLRVTGGKQVVENIAGASVLTSSMNMISPGQLFLKRLVDILGGLVLGLATLIVVAIVGPRIKKASPGPILYKQERIGQNGRKFKIYKIRSMYMDADQRKKDLMDQNRVADGMMFKLDWDPRIIGNEVLPDGTHKTGIGEFIRKTSLDELPQSINVLLGQMSLVGTRPPTVDEWEKYEFHHRARLAFKPGITGMWQVSGRSDITDFEEVTKLDTEYIVNWSIGLDIRILFKTFGTVLHRKGAM